MSYEPKPQEIMNTRRLEVYPENAERGRRYWETDAEVRERLIAEHEAQEKREQQKRADMKAHVDRMNTELKAEEEAAQKQRQAEADERLKAAARISYLSNPAATEADFERAWPAMREEVLRTSAVQQITAQKPAQELADRYIKAKYPPAGPDEQA